MAADQVGMELQIKPLQQFPLFAATRFSQTAPERGHKNSNISLRKAFPYEGDVAGRVSSLFCAFVSLFPCMCFT